MNDSYETSFGLILNAGNSKSKSLMAIEAAREFDFDEALSLIKEAQEDLRKAHQTQTDLIQAEAKGEGADINIILIHAQDHLTTAMILSDLAVEFVNIYRGLQQLREHAGIEGDLQID